MGQADAMEQVPADQSGRGSHTQFSCPPSDDELAQKQVVLVVEARKWYKVEQDVQGLNVHGHRTRARTVRARTPKPSQLQHTTTPPIWTQSKL
jgi:hypothetical protein